MAPSLRRLAAALSLVLLPFGVLEEGVSAQSGDAEIIGTITNTAEASWDFGGRRVQATSNTVTFDVTIPPAQIRAFRPTLQGAGTEFPGAAVQRGRTVGAKRWEWIRKLVDLD